MKEAVGATFLFNIVIFFVILFTAIMCLTINSSKAYGVKDEIVTIIEENIANNSGASVSETSVESDILNQISAILTEKSYRTTSTCPDGYTSYDRTGTKAFGDDASFCIAKYVTEDADNTYSTGAICTYSVIVFYKLDIPILSSVFNFEIKGETKTIYSSFCGIL